MILNTLSYYLEVGHTLLRIRSVVSLGILLRWCSLWWVCPGVAMPLTAILIGRLSLGHRCIKEILIVPA
jgi:fatty acid desaturase